MTAMKKKMVIIAVWVIAFVTSYIFCGTEQNDAGIDSIKIEEYTAALKEKQNEREKLRGTFQVLDGNILMLVHPSSGDNIFYKVRDTNCIILIDSFGNEPQKEVRKNYILKKKG